MDDIANLISTLGFPIVISIIFIYHSFSISDKFQTVISQNTETIKLLIDTLEKKGIINTDKGVTTNDNTDNQQGGNDQ